MGVDGVLYCRDGRPWRCVVAVVPSVKAGGGGFREHVRHGIRAGLLRPRATIGGCRLAAVPRELTAYISLPRTGGWSLALCVYERVPIQVGALGAFGFGEKRSVQPGRQPRRHRVR